MKRIAFILLCLFLPCLAFSQTPSRTLLPDQRVYDFGKIMERNGKVKHVFHFKNMGTKPVVINDISAWCGCTTYTYTKTPIRPGAKGNVTITYNPNNRPGFFSKEVVVMTEGGKYYTRVWVKGTVIPYQHPVTEDYPYSFGNGFYTNLKVLAFGAFHKGESKAIELRYANETNRPMILSFVISKYDGALRYTLPKLLPPKGRARINFIYIAQNDIHSNCSYRLYPVINGRMLRKPLVVSFFKL